MALEMQRPEMMPVAVSLMQENLVNGEYIMTFSKSRISASRDVCSHARDV